MRLRGARWRHGVLVALVLAASGTFVGAAMANGPVTFVRQFGATGSASGDLNAAAGLAVDPTTGNVLVADDDNERIDVFSSTGTFLKAWGAGVADGSSTTHQTCTSSCHQGVASASAGGLNRPKGVAVDSSGNVFVADSSNNRIDEFDSSGTFVKAWGWGVSDGQQQFETCTSACQAGISSGGAGGLRSPFGVTVGASGDVFVAEYGNSRVSEFNPASNPAQFVRTWGWGVSDQQQQFEICTVACNAGSSGTGAGGQGGAFDGAGGITVDPSSGDVYVLDSLNYRVQQFHATGAFVRTWGWGVSDGQQQFESCSVSANCQSGIFGHGGAGQFANAISQPVGIAADATGNLDAVDEDNNRVQQFAGDGTFRNMFGYGVADGQNQFENCSTGCQQGNSGTSPGQLFGPTGIAADATGNVYVDNGNVIEQYSVPVAAPATHTLAVTKAGSGAGTVSSSPVGIDCGATCSASFNDGTQVTLSATPGVGSTFAGWSGADCSGTGSCQITLSAPMSVTATFTLIAPAAPTGLTASTVSSREIDLSWNQAQGASGYRVLRGTSSGGPYSPVGTPSGTSFADPGLSSGTTYYYVVQATNGGGSSPNSGEASATTTPAAPTGVVASAASSSEIDLSWNSAQGASGYRVLRGTSSGGPYTPVGTPSGTSFADTGLRASTTYFYVVEATNSGGNSADSSQTSATTNSLPTHALTVTRSGAGSGTVTSAPSGIACGQTCSAAFTDGTQVTLTATPDAGSTFTGWSGGGCSGTGTCQINLTAPTNVTASFAPVPAPLVTGVSPTFGAVGGGNTVTITGQNFVSGASVAFGASPGTNVAVVSDSEITATVPAGSAGTVDVTVTTGSGQSPISSADQYTYGAAPPRLTGLVATTAGPSEIDLSWTPASGLVTGPYRVSRSESPGGPYSLVGTPTQPSLADTGLKPATTYYYVVQVADGAAYSRDSAVASATTTPSAPTQLTATAVSQTRIDLKWAAVQGATNYRVLWGTSPGNYSDDQQISDITLSATGLNAATTYYFAVEALGSGGPSPTSSEASATTAANTPPPPGPPTLTVNILRGNGTIISSPAGINCDPHAHALACSAQFPTGTQVTLTATPDTGMEFTGWQSGCASESATFASGQCTLTMSGDQTVLADFGLSPAYVATTGAASHVTTTGAELTGEITAGPTAGNLPISGVFSIGPVGRPNQQFGTGSNINWFGPAYNTGGRYPTFDYQIWATGLTPATTYEYRIAVIHSGDLLNQTLAVGNPLQFTTSSVAIGRAGTITGNQVSTTLTCATATACTGTAAVVVTAGGLSADTSGASASHGSALILGKAKFRIAGKHRGTITVHLTRHGAAYLQHHGKAKVQLQTRVRVGKHTAISAQALELRRR